MPSGGMMSVQTVCLGWHWMPYRYSRTADDVDGAAVKRFPRWLADLGRRALAEALEIAPQADGALAEALEVEPQAGRAPEVSPQVGETLAGAERPAAYEPDVALINFYDGSARMGMHADKDERSAAPVVSLSLGDTCLFRFGNAQSRGRPWHDIELESGDLFVFGGASRLAYHGVLRTMPGTGDPSIGLPGGRLNITLRESGLS
jgi:alkylated DNA repair protein (DNA oxidative demethylase)